MRTTTAAASVLVAALSLGFGATAFAGPRCTDAPRSAWMDQSTMLRQLADAGYRMKSFEVTQGQCYRIRGNEPDGAKVKVYFDPVDGKVVERKRS